MPGVRGKRRGTEKWEREKVGKCEGVKVRKWAGEERGRTRRHGDAETGDDRKLR